jgi:flavodoxin I
MNKTVLIFWPKGGNVENAAHMIAKEFGNITELPMDNVTKDTLDQFDRFIVGGSSLGAETWEGTQNESPWNKFFNTVKSVDFSDKKVALFGLGDQVLWPSSFVDSLGTIYNAFIEASAQIVGAWPTDGYDFTDSKAVKDDHFVGLALDEDQQDELSEGRIQAWIKQIKAEF